MNRCHDCFDEHLPIRSLAEKCAAATVTHIGAEAHVVLRCRHGAMLRHVIYLGNPDMEWALRLAEHSIAV
jgi:hypothetical protein